LPGAPGLQWRPLALAAFLAIAANLLLVGLLANLNRSAQTSKPAPARLTWMALRPAPERPEPKSPPPRRLPPLEKPQIEPKGERSLLKPQQFQPRSLKPRASFAPSLDIHPELSALSLQLAVNLPGLPAPGLTSLEPYSAGFLVPESAGVRVAEPGLNAHFGPGQARTPNLSPRLGQARPTDPVKLREPEQPPMPAYAPRPEYPVAALRQGIEGYVTLRLLVSADGKVESVEALECQGHESFARAAINTVSRWRFRPARRDGAPAPFWCSQKISFNLAENRDR
jgi:protein TonB